MTVLIIAIPISIALGLGFLVAFLWSVEAGQLKDLDNKAKAILDNNEREQDGR